MKAATSGEIVRFCLWYSLEVSKPRNRKVDLFFHEVKLGISLFFFFLYYNSESFSLLKFLLNTTDQF